MEHFVNDGYGWTCRRCGAGDEPRDQSSLADSTLPRFFREGEAEERATRLSTRALARWKDDARRALVCTRCGTEESLAPDA